MSCFVPTVEQDALRASVRRLLAEQSASSAVRKCMDSADGIDRELWRRLADLGLVGLGLPGDVGAVGSTAVDLAIVSEELGAALACVPFLSDVLAGRVLAEAGDGPGRSILSDVVAGTRRATLANVSPEGDWSAAAGGVSARHDGSAWRLDGAKSYVLDGGSAEIILVTAGVGDALSLFAVDAGADGLVRDSLPTLDMTRRLARLELRSTPAALLGATGAAEEILTPALNFTAVALAAEQVGVARRCLEMSVEYAKMRYQFGRPIGSFQAIKHKCADMLVALESARSATYYAAQSAADGDDKLAEAATLAKIVSCDAAFRNAAENIQIHGGIGFTWEHDAHLFFKRAKSAQLLFGDPIEQHRRLADLVGIS